MVNGGIEIMNKKQGAIIVTLLVLIVLAGVLAAKSNGPLSTLNDTDNGKGAISSLKTTDAKNTSSKTEFFTESRLTRDQKQNKALTDLKVLMEDKNIAKEDKAAAISKYTEIATAGVYENKVETALKGNGFSDIFCSVEEDGVRIIVKSNDKLTDKQKKQISNVVLSIVKAKDIEIDEAK